MLEVQFFPGCLNGIKKIFLKSDTFLAKTLLNKLCHREAHLFMPGIQNSFSPSVIVIAFCVI